LNVADASGWQRYSPVPQAEQCVISLTAVAAVPEFVLPFTVGDDYLIVMNGSDLLTAYRDTGSESAFSDLVRRYTNLVYSIAKRRLSNGPLAEEVTQTVFTRLAMAALKVRGDAELVAWLHRTTIHVAIDVWRTETRRRTREQHAAVMEPAPAESTQLWDEIAPNLDEALNQLGEADRQAVLLRFFDQKPMRDIGRILGVSEDAAKMRVSRALDRLRTQLASRGVTCTVVMLASLVAERSIEAAPSHLVTSLSSVKFVASAGVTGAGAALSLFTRLLILMSKAKLTTALLVFAAVGIGVIGIRRAFNSSAPPNDNITAAGGARATSPPGSRRPSRPASTRVAGDNFAAELNRTPNAAELEDAKQKLRALLVMPPHGGRYPPAELLRVLHKFGDQTHEAMPILVEALGVQDYETRRWAISGVQYVLNSLRTTPAADERAQQAFALARPVLSQILKSPDEPDMLRMIAVSTYLPQTFYPGGTPKLVSLNAESVEDLLASLHTPENKSRGFRFTIVDMLGGHFANQPDDAATFIAAMQPRLNDPNPYERLLAAFAIASWPGEKPAAVKDILLAEVKAQTTTRSYRAVQGLGKLGAQAADTVPDLLAYAEAWRDDGGAGYAEGALEAACRLQPDLRSQYPDIDAKLKQEEASLLQTMTRTMGVTILGPGEVASTLADPDKGPALLQGLVSSLAGNPEPEKAKEVLLAHLEQAMAQASDSQRAAIEAAIEKVRQTDTSPKETEPERPALPLANLVLDARVLLVDSDNPNRNKLEQVLGEFQDQHIQGVTNSGVTAERFAELARSLRNIDPEFQKAWRKQVLLNYPGLDRILPPEEQ
jgi:RNA polymerase sigma factor (sigma-70 family)